MQIMRKSFGIAAGLMLAGALAACESMGGGDPGDLSASGVIEAPESEVSSEIGGRVAEVFVSEGEAVTLGQPLFRLDGDWLELQRDSAQAAVEAAEANLQATRVARAEAEAAIEVAASAMHIAELQLESALNSARMLEAPARLQAWDLDLPNEIALPPWYFEQQERIQAAQLEVAAAAQALEQERQQLQLLLAESGNQDLAQAEARLAQAQAAFLVIDELRDRPIDAADRRYVRDFLDDLHQAAEAELESAQEAYESLLTEGDAADVLEARARLAVAAERHALANQNLILLRSGDYSLEVQLAQQALESAQARLQQAEAAAALVVAQRGQAEKAVAQARTQLQLAELQLEKLTVRAGVEGVIMIRSVDPGELIQPGLVTMTIGQLNALRVTVYLPEDRYGLISVGDEASLTVDSYPGESFSAQVTRIADRAEYTPRNVQTEEDRRTTVYAVELAVADPEAKLIPGMPADVLFSP